MFKFDHINFKNREQMNYDDWKLSNPYDDEKDNECSFCGVPCDGHFCSKECRIAEMND